jgi:hypothetical protein
VPAVAKSRPGEVALHPAVELGLVARLHLPEPGDPGLHAEAPPVPDVVLGDFRDEGRSRPDKAHVALQDVPQLGQLVDARGAQRPPEPRDARVVGGLEDDPVALVEVLHLRQMLLGSRNHRPELVDRERAPLNAGPGLAEEDRGAVAQADRERGDQEDGAQDDEPD